MTQSESIVVIYVSNMAKITNKKRQALLIKFIRLMRVALSSLKRKLLTFS